MIFVIPPTKNTPARTPLLAGGSPQVCKVWLQSQLERDWSLWRGDHAR